MKQLLSILLLVAPVFGQSTGAATITMYPGVPTGSCTIGRNLAMDSTTGILYSCVNGAWTSGGGTSLTECSTPSAGNFVCNNSLAVSQGGEGVLSLGYSGLPTPPTTATFQFAADNTGTVWVTPGASTPFARVMTGSTASPSLLEASSIDTSTTTTGLGNIFPAMSTFPSSPCNSIGWNPTSKTPPCADYQPTTFATTPPVNAYTLSVSDKNHVLEHKASGTVTDTIPDPTAANQMGTPFTFGIDTNCVSTVVLTQVAGGKALFNGRSTLQINPCGWGIIWADPDGVDWHVEDYSPAGGVNAIP